MQCVTDRMHSGRCADGRATPEGAPYDIASGERLNFEQYCAAIHAARRSICIENRQIDVPEIVDCLHRALTRDVDVVLLVPSDPDVSLQTQLEQQQALLKPLVELGIFDNFMLVGIAGMGIDGRRKSVYVHSKLMLIDDEWTTVGSCNLHRFSLFGNSEMNAAFSDPPQEFAPSAANSCGNTWIGTHPAWMIGARSSYSVRSRDRTVENWKLVIMPGRDWHSSLPWCATRSREATQALAPRLR